MHKSFLLLNKFVTDESGQDLIEYALIAGLVGLAAVTALTSVAGAITTLFNNIKTQLAAAGSAT